MFPFTHKVFIFWESNSSTLSLILPPVRSKGRLTRKGGKQRYIQSNYILLHHNHEFGIQTCGNTFLPKYLCVWTIVCYVWRNPCLCQPCELLSTPLRKYVNTHCRRSGDTHSRMIQCESLHCFSEVSVLVPSLSHPHSPTLTLPPSLPTFTLPPSQVRSRLQNHEKLPPLDQR